MNNAGILIHGLIEWQSIELMKKTFEVNYWGMVRVTKAMLPLLKKSRGRIVNVTSLGGIVKFSLYYKRQTKITRFKNRVGEDFMVKGL